MALRRTSSLPATAMPRPAMDAALETFARVVRERHPGAVVLPLGDVGPDRTVLAPATGKVIWPFAAHKGRPVRQA